VSDASLRPAESSKWQDIAGLLEAIVKEQKITNEILVAISKDISAIKQISENSLNMQIPAGQDTYEDEDH
jgi:hypothetical protein